MPIATHLARSYAIRMIIIAVLSVGFGLWGAYDLWVKLPRDQAIFNEHQEVVAKRMAFEKRDKDGETLTVEERAEWQAAAQRESELAPGGSVPVPPGEYDALIQWLYISCIPFGIWYGFVYISLKRKVWRLDEEGTFHLPGGEMWHRDEIADIDMSKWMAKSKAFIVHADGRREMLDDYIHKDSHLIVGKMAHERYPEEWHEDGRKVKPEDEEGESSSGDDESDLSGGDEASSPEVVEMVNQAE